MHPLVGIWLVINAVCAYGIIIASLYDAEREPSNIFFFPKLVESLRENLNKTGTIIATILISAFLAPAIIAYYTAGSIVFLIYLFCKGFVKLFKRKD